MLVKGLRPYMIYAGEDVRYRELIYRPDFYDFDKEVLVSAYGETDCCWREEPKKYGYKQKRLETVSGETGRLAGKVYGKARQRVCDRTDG